MSKSMNSSEEELFEFYQILWHLKLRSSIWKIQPNSARPKIYLKKKTTHHYTQMGRKKKMQLM